METTRAEPPPVFAAPDASARPRLNSIDLLRGIVMVVMALDHTREYFEFGQASARDVHHPALFLTRWVTHFCAPTFIFLAGMSAYLFGRRGRDRRTVSGFLLTRGLWLVLLELTVIRFGWGFKLAPDFILLAVFWVIGWSMVALSGLQWLPRPILAVLSVALIAGHNLLDGIKAESWGQLQWVWMLLHQPGLLQPTASVRVLAIYPFLPWLGVMLAGYCLGPVLAYEPSRRRAALMSMGAGLIVLFLALRASGVYGDRTPRVGGEGWAAAVLSFINCEKYPPSLLFLAMTLGPLLIALVAVEKARGKVTEFFVVFGRVPLLYYVAHIYLIHALAVLAALLQGQNVAWLFGGLPPMSRPPTWGFGLPAIYGWWLVVVLSLYPLCRWFAALKQRRKDWWLSYL